MSVSADKIESTLERGRDEWPSVKLADCCAIVSGGTPKSSEASYWGGDILWATPKDLTELDSKYISSTPRTITESGYAKSSATTLPADSVLFSSRAPIGHVAINTVPMCTNQGFKSLVPDTTLVFADYLYYWLRANKAQLQALGNGATFKEVSKAVISKVEIPLPPLPEQRRIAAILDKADALRQKRRAAIAKLDQLLQSVFLEMFGDPVINPMAWPKADFADIVYFQEGPGVRKWQFRSAGVKLVNVINIVDGELDLSRSSRHLEADEVDRKYQHFLLEAGDYVMASSGVTWGKIAEVRSEHLPLCLNTSMIRVRPRDARLDKRYLRVFIEGPSFRRQIERLITGSAQPNFGPSHLKQLRIPVPPIETQRAFAARANNAAAQKDRSETQLDRLESLFASIQQRAFTAQL